MAQVACLKDPWRLRSIPIRKFLENVRLVATLPFFFQPNLTAFPAFSAVAFEKMTFPDGCRASLARRLLPPCAVAFRLSMYAFFPLRRPPAPHLCLLGKLRDSEDGGGRLRPARSPHARASSILSASRCAPHCTRKHRLCLSATTLRWLFVILTLFLRLDRFDGGSAVEDAFAPFHTKNAFSFSRFCGSPVPLPFPCKWTLLPGIPFHIFWSVNHRFIIPPSFDSSIAAVPPVSDLSRPFSSLF